MPRSRAQAPRGGQRDAKGSAGDYKIPKTEMQPTAAPLSQQGTNGEGPCGAHTAARWYLHPNPAACLSSGASAAW